MHCTYWVTAELWLACGGWDPPPRPSARFSIFIWHRTLAHQRHSYACYQLDPADRTSSYYPISWFSPIPAEPSWEPWTERQMIELPISQPKSTTNMRVTRSTTLVPKPCQLRYTWQISNQRISYAAWMVHSDSTIRWGSELEKKPNIY